MGVAYSQHGVPIRLTPERWVHIVENHDDLAGHRDRILEAIEDPDAIAHGQRGELMALKTLKDRTLVVVYRELSKADGFVITAFFTTQPKRILKRGLAWQKR